MRYIGITLLFVLMPFIGFPMDGMTQCPPGSHPIVDVSTEFLFGGCVAGKWVGWDYVTGEVPMKITGTEKYRLYNSTQFQGIATGGKPQYQLLNDGPARSPIIDLTLPKSLKSKKDVIGICGEWNALPRTPTILSANHQVYRQVIRDLLDQHGLKNSPVNIARILRIDLEGDGTDEVLINATTSGYSEWPPFLTNREFYSVVILRKIVNGTVRDIPVVECYALKGTSVDLQSLFTLDVILDVNGDGRMEIIASGKHFEGGYDRSIYEVNGNNVQCVLFVGEGP